MTIPQVREALTALVGGASVAYLGGRRAHEAVKLILQIKPNMPNHLVMRLGLGLSVVELGPPNQQDGRRIEFIDNGGASELWAGYSPKPRYFAQPDGSVKICYPVKSRKLS